MAVKAIHDGLIDLHDLHLSDALVKLQGLALYAVRQADAYRRNPSLRRRAVIMRVLDLKRQDVRDAIAVGQDAEVLFSSGLADDWLADGHDHYRSGKWHHLCVALTV